MYHSRCRAAMVAHCVTFYIALFSGALAQPSQQPSQNRPKFEDVARYAAQSGHETTWKKHNANLLNLSSRELFA